MKYPTVHLGGTSKNMLLKGYEDCCSAIRVAITILSDQAPHGRDYTQQNDFIWAQEEHIYRISRLHTILDELNRLCHHISNQPEN